MEYVLIAVFFVVATYLGNFVVRGILALAQRRSENHATATGDGRDGQPNAEDPADASPKLRGGLWIGILERAAIFLFLIAGYSSGIAVVIAIKGLARYPDFKDSSETAEKFIIGTLASLFWVVFVWWAGSLFVEVAW
ncbi:hypothetical protein [Jonesia quinghaiensis]|uniref:hypothetical protein n=1 Tax=Jonesia quinghaiensis TaxID=262806 RepID=UPI0004011C93|nr:hypothetical protein [Jonesia quinghaiensis]